MFNSVKNLLFNIKIHKRNVKLIIKGFIQELHEYYSIWRFKIIHQVRVGTREWQWWISQNIHQKRHTLVKYRCFDEIRSKEIKPLLYWYSGAISLLSIQNFWCLRSTEFDWTESSLNNTYFFMAFYLLITIVVSTLENVKLYLNTL